ncbi:MAG: hypothetical protein FLDDKLPJ_03311 [Phycisphaerae bacterium]|nr:hypothetical protein [Phycisphaerae bacterium]
MQTRYKYESAYATKDLFLHYRPEYDDQRFVTKVTNATRWGAGAGSDHDELARFAYTFDAAGNRLSNAGHRGTGGNAEGFHKIQNIDNYFHDGLHRLTKVDYNMAATTGDEIYVYDSLGNRVTYTDQRNATTRAYANNVANEYASVATFAVTHDAAGNLSKQTVNGDGDAYVYTYDCDNRLLGVTFEEAGVGATPLATFAYDALGRKITAWTQYDVAGGGDSQTADLRFYHDGQVELADYHSDGTLARRFVNGTQYIDERVALIEGEAGEADTFYYLLQELFTVTGLVEKNGALAEADVYDGYGKVRLWDYSPGDFDRDGDVDATDQTTFTTAMGLGAPGTPTPDPSTDLDYDGDTDLTDAGLFNTIKNAGGAVAERFVSSLGNPFHFTGRRLYMLETLPEADATPVANQQLQHNRARHYSPLEGRWLQRDIVDSSQSSVYQYVESNPSKWIDWNGEAAAHPIPPLVVPQPPSKPTPPPPKPGLFNPCGCRVHRQEIKWFKVGDAKHPEIGNTSYEEFIGHTWIDCGGFGNIYDYPQGFQDGDFEDKGVGQGRWEKSEWIWGTTKNLLSSIQAGPAIGKSCICATCDDIRSCLQAAENVAAPCRYSEKGLGVLAPPEGYMNCRYFTATALSQCCLIQNFIPDRAFDVGPSDTFVGDPKTPETEKR